MDAATTALSTLNNVLNKFSYGQTTWIVWQAGQLRFSSQEHKNFLPRPAVGGNVPDGEIQARRTLFVLPNKSADFSRFYQHIFEVHASTGAYCMIQNGHPDTAALACYRDVVRHSMGVFPQFENFDPLTGDVPHDPFPSLPGIAARARSVLEKRTSDQIYLDAFEIACAIKNYFVILKNQAIDRLWDELDGDGVEEYFVLNGARDDRRNWTFRDEKTADLDIETDEDISEIEKLKMVIGVWSGTNTIEHPRFSWEEHFAVYSIFQVADVVQWIRCHTDEMDGYSETLESALTALEAVCYVDYMRESSRLWQVVLRNLSKRDEWHQRLEQARLEDERSQRSIRAEAMNVARHQKTNEAKARAIQEWVKDPSKFPSAEKAGNHFADWLAEQGFRYEPRTVTAWIRTYARQEGIRIR